MRQLIDELTEQGKQHKGGELGGLLQWAALHIASQNEAIEQWAIDFEDEHRERIKFERALHEAKQAIESALAMVSAPLCPPIELGRDFAPHINLMAGHGDPDYLTRNGMSVRHVDLRTPTPITPRKKKA